MCYTVHMSIDMNEEQPSNFLGAMVRKLDSIKDNEKGYLTTIPELHGILSELPPNETVAVIRKPITQNNPDLIAVEVKLTIVLSRADL